MGGEQFDSSQAEGGRSCRSTYRINDHRKNLLVVVFLHSMCFSSPFPLSPFPHSSAPFPLSLSGVSEQTIEMRLSFIIAAAADETANVIDEVDLCLI